MCLFLREMLCNRYFRLNSYANKSFPIVRQWGEDGGVKNNNRFIVKNNSLYCLDETIFLSLLPNPSYVIYVELFDLNYDFFEMLWIRFIIYENAYVWFRYYYYYYHNNSFNEDSHSENWLTKSISNLIKYYILIDHN